MALTGNFVPSDKEDADDEKKRLNGKKHSSVVTIDYGESKLKDTKQDKDLNKYVANPQQDGEHNDKKTTTGNNTGKDGQTPPGGTQKINCPPGKSTEEHLKAISAAESAKGYSSPVKIECQDKTDTKQGNSSTTPGPGLPGSTPLPGTIDLAGQNAGAGKMVTNPVDLQNKVVNYQGQQYFNPQGGLPTAPSGYSWQGRDFSTLINNATNTAVSVADTLKMFNSTASQQTNARTPSSGTNPSTPSSTVPSTPTNSSNIVTQPLPDPASVPAGAVSMANRVALAKAAGFSEANAIKMGAISQAESSGNSYAHNPYGRDDSYGLWQINMLGSMGVQRNALFKRLIPNYVDRSSLYNPWINAQAAKIIYDQQGLSAWSTYSSGAYSRYMSAAASGSGSGITYQSAGGAGGIGGTGVSYGIGGNSIGAVGGGGSAGGTGGSSSSNIIGGGLGANAGGSLGLMYNRNPSQQEGQGGYIAQAAAATIAARTGNLNTLSQTSQLGGLASNALGNNGGQVPSGSVSPNYNVPNWSGTSGAGGAGGSGLSSARDSGINPASSIGNIPNNSAGMFPTSMTDFSGVNGLGAVNPVLNNTGTTPFASTTPTTPGSNMSTPTTPSSGGAGGGSTNQKKKGKAETKKQENERPGAEETSTTKRMNRAARSKSNDDKELDKKLDKSPPLRPKRPENLGKPLTQGITGRKTEGDEGPENQSVQPAPGIDPQALVSDFGGMAKNLSGAIPGLESIMSRIPNEMLGSFIGNMPTGLQSLLPQGLISGLNLGPVSLNNMLQMVGGGALGSMAGQLIRSMSGGIPVASMLTQSLQSVPISQVFGSLGQDIGTSAAAIANTLGSITNVASMGVGGIPVNSAQLNQAISYAVASSGSALSVPINTLGIASQITNNPIGSLVNIAMGGMIANGSVPIVPTNLSGTNAALLAGLSQKIPQEDAQKILTIGQITNLLPPNVRNLIPQVSPSAFGGPTNYVQNNRNNTARQTDPNQVHGGGGGGGGSQIDFQDADKTNVGDTRNIPYGMKLSENFTLYQLTTGVAVSHGCHPLLPLHGMTNDEVIHNLMLLARNILEPIRANIGPFTINSGFRGNDSTTKGNPNWQRSLHGYGRAADLSWGSSGRIAQAHAFAAARLHATENLHEGTWLHIAVANGIGGKGGVANTRTPEGNIQQGSNMYKGWPGQVLSK